MSLRCVDCFCHVQESVIAAEGPGKLLQCYEETFLEVCPCLFSGTMWMDRTEVSDRIFTFNTKKPLTRWSTARLPINVWAR